MAIHRNRRVFASLVFAAAVGLSAAAARADVTVKGKDGGVELKLPDGWEESPLPDGASETIQAMALNKKQDTGVLVAVVDRSDLEAKLADYADKYVAGFAKAKTMTNVTKTALKAVKVDGKDAMQCELRCTSNGVKLAYLITVVQTDKSFECVMGWTTQSKFTKLKADLAKLPADVTEVKAADDAK